MAASETSSARNPVLVGVLGVVIGAVLGGLAQAFVEWQKHEYEVTRVRSERAEEIMTLVSESMPLYLQLKPQMLGQPLNTKPPVEPERVVALVELYFPKLHPLASDFELACVQHFEALQELAMKFGGKRGDAVDDNVTFKRVYDARNRLMAALATEAGSIGRETTDHRITNIESGVTWLKLAGAILSGSGSLVLAWRAREILKWVVYALVAHETSITQLRRILSNQPQTGPVVEGVMVHVLDIESKLGIALFVIGFVLFGFGMLCNALSVMLGAH